ncbi:hypothetical protein A6A04_12220 [Paramagnetospirillum marisnigri]|uniref:Acyltransferase 3 domain-containing protein n=1 Tax=Paramagnetospirillum marisnigri TaxID=1285242 RepID=A0A178MYD4_9PROT|nr:acyltransferase [Paramagnetospirillum marisnigri]OAN54683.1 hypothetical protein A6A04_12220 [Paramagnetospirillum marisnigri]
MKPEQKSENQNNFGLMRLVFASLVIVSHAPEMLDGTSDREPLVRLFGTLSFGEFAVDCFFLISGYLVSSSYISDPSLRNFAVKRLLRIYPAFILAYLISILVIGPIAGSDLGGLDLEEWWMMVSRMLRLGYPVLPTVFPDQMTHFLNGAMWTISYEFRCYVIAAALGLIGAYRRPTIFVGYILAIVALNAAFITGQITDQMLDATRNHTFRNIFLDPVHMSRFLLVFACGTAFRLLDGKIPYRTDFAVFATIALAALMFVKPLAEPALCLFGGYLLFFCAFRTPLIAINDRYDFSYGTYLYGWPITALLIHYVPDIGLAQLTTSAFALALMAGALSWFGLENWAIRQKRRFTVKRTFRQTAASS